VFEKAVIVFKYCVATGDTLRWESIPQDRITNRNILVVHKCRRAERRVLQNRRKLVNVTSLDCTVAFCILHTEIFVFNLSTQILGIVPQMRLWWLLPFTSFSVHHMWSPCCLSLWDIAVDFFVIPFLFTICTHSASWVQLRSYLIKK
jgi:hypothetical protein